MRGNRSIILFTACVLLAVPLASADWSGRGFREPDTARDAEDGYMFADPDTTGGKKVYFNIYSSFFIVSGNPNVGTTGSRVMPYPSSVHAMLGVWNDCNDDGYIGVTEGALMEYRAELLTSDDICPAGVSPHNDGEWVQEFIWIGPDNPNVCADPEALETDGDNDDYAANIVDDCARVWGDFGLPEQAGTSSCPVNPRPRGTYQSTGGFLRFVDCLDGWRITGAVNTVDSDGSLGLSFADAPQSRPDQSGSTLNQPNPYGQEDDAAYVSVADCSGEGTTVEDPTGGDLHRIGVSDPTGAVPNEVEDPAQTGLFTDDTIELEDEDGNYAAVNTTDEDNRVVTVHNVAPSTDLDGSPAGTVNETLEATPDVGALGGDGDCDRSDGIGENSNLYELEEADFEATGAVRVQTDFYMSFAETFPRGGLSGANQENDLIGEGAPFLYGENVYTGPFNVPVWFGAPGYVASRNPYVNRDTLAPWGAVVVTGYAYVSPGAVGEYGLALPSSGASVYGADHCDGTAPLTGAFECDAGKWWRGPAGEDIRTVWQVVVNDPYNLRDIDCWDATVASGTPSATATVAGNACP